MSRLMLLTIGLLSLTGCQQDRFTAPGTWQPTYANEANLREMLANPDDLRIGEAAKDARGQVAAVAVNRLLLDKQRRLSTSSTSTVGNVQGAGSEDAPAIH